MIHFKKTTLKKTKFLYTTLIAAAIFAGCSKGGDPDPTPQPPPPPPPVQTQKTCIITGVFQRNSGSKAELAIQVNYNTSLDPTAISVYDSAAGKNVFNASLQYVTADSIRIDAYQYIRLDASKRVTVLVTKSDMNDIANADTYRYEYAYNGDGYLATKNLFVNGSKTPDYVTTYTYTNGLLTGCIMGVGGSASQKLLESTLTYDASVSPKTTLYAFPDGFESYYYTAALNFGKKSEKALSRVVTKIYNTANSTLLDTWTTNYSSYSIDGNGYMTFCNATGDQQQGIAGFYGKTYFSYQCL
jgi:hypothetical protein